jgi:hypothetical protein
VGINQPISGSGGGGGGSGADEKAKVSANDTTAGYLNGKLVAGANVTLTELGDGGNETLSIASTAGGAPADAPYATFGPDATLSAEVDLYGFQGVNLVKNSPGQIVTDGAEPQWWDDVANATLTDEDTAGEGIADKTERVFKVVTTANDVYGYQTLTFADESLLDAGQTVVSFSCWVYCATGSKASIGIYGTNLGLQESSQAGAGAWELLAVEGQTLNAADTAIELRLIVDTDTAWFTMPMLTIGTKTLPWVERNLQFVPLPGTIQYDLNTTGDVAWSDTDLTANTDPLAAIANVRLYIDEPDGTLDSKHSASHSDHVTGADFESCKASVQRLAAGFNSFQATMFLDDGQLMRYSVSEIDADNDVRAIMYLNGYWRWAN